MGVVIRKANPSDLPDLVKMLTMMKTESGRPPASSHDIVGITQNVENFYVAEENGKIIGMRAAVPSHPLRVLQGKRIKEKRGTFLADTFVHPDHRRRGISSALLREVLKDHWQRDNLFATAETPLGEHGLTKFGFKKIGECVSCERATSGICRGKPLFRLLKRR